MSEYGRPMVYEDIDTDMSAVRERLLESLLSLPPTCFFRTTPVIYTEELFASDEVIHKAYYRYSELKTEYPNILGFEEDEDE